ncbi:MAG: glucokinase [Gammaproteobacteria bacterium]
MAKFVHAHRHPIAGACFAISGPVKDGRGKPSNLPWWVDAHQLARQLDVAMVGLINDLEANAWGVAALEDQDFLTLNQGDPNARGNAAIIAAGTGLGEAGFYWDGKDYLPFACEGGHADFAPNNELEVELFRYLLTKFEHVSYERVLSGPGLYNLYQFLRDSGRGEEPAWLAEKMRAGDPSAAIAQAALEGSCALSVQALDWFVALYGAEAGNLALKIMSTGGMYVGGGIAPKIIAKLKTPLFMQAFVAKGRLRPVMEAMPVRVILNDKTALLGTARFAALRCATTPSALA